MPRARQYLLFAGALALLALVLYTTYRGRPKPFPRPSATAQEGLAWIPAQATLLVGVDLAGLRQQSWLVGTIQQVAGDVREEPDYAAFVTATGFDYSRDLDHLWLGAFGPAQQPQMAGVAQGRFARNRILAYVREQGATLRRHQGFEIYELSLAPAAAGEPPRRFAVAFLDDSHLAFGSDAERAGMVIDCWLGRAAAVDSDPARRDELQQLAAGWQAWAVDTSGLWESLFSGNQPAPSDMGAVIAQLAVGLRAGEQGLELGAEARCREPGQAKRLHDNLKLMALLGQVALSRQKDETMQALGEALKNLSLAQREQVVEARLVLSPATVATLLRAAPATARRK
jgi:hypothetical protein